jgi:hypothetical protein
MRERPPAKAQMAHQTATAVDARALPVPWAAIYNRPMKATIGAITSALLVILGSLAPLFAQAPAQQQQPEFVKQGQQLMGEGKPEDALALYRQIPLKKNLGQT